MLFVLLTALSFAWDVQPSGPFGPENPDDVVPVYIHGKPVLAVLTRTHLVLIDAKTGAEIDRTASDAVGLAIADTQVDGAQELIVCNRIGPADVWTLGPGLESSVRLVDEGWCYGALGMRNGDVLLAGPELVRYTPSGSGLVVDRIIDTPDGFAARRLAESGGDIVAIDPNSWERRYLGDEDGMEALAISDLLTDVAGGPRGLWASSIKGLRNLQSDPQEVLQPAEVRALLHTDIDGDGTDDRVLGDDTGILIEVGTTTRQIEGRVDRLVSIDVDGDGCHSPVRVTSEGVFLQRVIACGGDADKDGMTSEEGDCDDSDPTTYTGADEQCDEVDHDCDGAHGDVPFVVSVPSEMDEGTPLDMPIDYCGFLPHPQFVVSPQPPIECASEDCGIGDDGEVTVTVHSDGFADLDQVFTVTVSNVAPFVDSPVEEGVHILPLALMGGGIIPVRDAFDLDVLVTVVDGPRWLEISPAGTVLSDAPRNGEWDATLRLDDQDGGITEVEVQFRTPPRSSQCSGGCDPEISCSTTSLPFTIGGLGGLVLLVMRRRKFRR